MKLGKFTCQLSFISFRLRLILIFDSVFKGEMCFLFSICLVVLNKQLLLVVLRTHNCCYNSTF